MIPVIEVRHFVARSGRDVFEDWFSRLPDRRAQAKIAVRIDRLAAGNFGDAKRLRGKLWELRIDWGPGYRVYFTMPAKNYALLLCGGDKRKQSADIDRAIMLLEDFEERTSRHEKKTDDSSR